MKPNIKTKGVFEKIEITISQIVEQNDKEEKRKENRRAVQKVHAYMMGLCEWEDRKNRGDKISDKITQ